MIERVAALAIATTVMSLVVAVPMVEAQVTKSENLCDLRGGAQFSDVADDSYGGAYIL